MTRYSREDIQNMLNRWVYELSLREGIYGYEEGLVKAISQLLEENRILREGLEFYADSYTWVSNSGKMGINLINKDTEIIPGTHGAIRYCGGKKARETLNKADQVGKGEG